MSMEQLLRQIWNVDIFTEGRKKELFVGRPFYIDYESAQILVSDAWKHRVKGIPQGTFLLAFYDGEEGVEEAVLLRALTPSKLPTDNDVVSSMIEYYKEGSDISGRAGSDSKSKLDDFTRYEFSFSGLKCSVLGTFYKTYDIHIEDGEENKIEKLKFGADLENFYSANNYSVYKATGDVLFKIVNQRDGNIIAGNENEFTIGTVRYSSSRRFQSSSGDVQVKISPQDFVGKRTALFGMTRTGKSNTVKKIIEATAVISRKAPNSQLPDVTADTPPFTKDGAPQYPVGQIIFDVNGEYANPNLQDEGTAIYELFEQQVERYSIIDKTDKGFKVLKINFYNEIEAGFQLIANGLTENKKSSDYIQSFCSIDLSEPENYKKPKNEKTDDEHNAANIYDRKIAIYKCCLHKAGFKLPENDYKVKFFGDGDSGINQIISDVKPHESITLGNAELWFTEVFEAMADDDHKEKFEKYKKRKKIEFFDEDMLALMTFLTRKSAPEKKATYSGYRLLNPFKNLHTALSKASFEVEILTALRQGKIIIIDLAQGDEKTRNLYSEKITRKIFENSMYRFTHTLPNNHIQFYFEEAHNLFPKKEDKDLSDVYNRLAKEGAKLHLGMTYATQEVSSISSNILKNTQNWFIAHLNNEDELKELRKYYDFSDFIGSLLRFSSGNDKGFVRMKTYTNPFVVPVQIAKFEVPKKDAK